VTRRSPGGIAAIVVAVLLSAAASVGASSVSASAAPPTSPIVLVSTDGVSYQPALAIGLFSNAGLLVPGDTATSDLFIKNPLATPATIRVNVGDVQSSSSELADNVQLTAVDTATGSTVTATWRDLAACDVMVLPVTVAGGAVLHISLALAMMNAPGLVAQNQDASLTADVQMKDAAAGSFPASTCSPNVTDPSATPPATTQPAVTQPASTQPRKILGYTGETFPTQLLLLGGTLVGVGWFLVVARRRRKREEVQQ
jgi:LPXTG-motif cell wall-anchored protein